MQLAHVLVQEARIEPASVTLWKDQKLQDLAAAHTRIDSRAREAAALALSGNDPRRALLRLNRSRPGRGLPGAGLVDTLLHPRPWKSPSSATSQKSRALELAARYIGSLPPRPRHDPSLVRRRQVAGFGPWSARWTLRRLRRAPSDFAVALCGLAGRPWTPFDADRVSHSGTPCAGSA